MADIESLTNEGQEAVVEPQTDPEVNDGQETVVASPEPEGQGGAEGAQRDAEADQGAKQSRRINHEAKLARQQAERETEKRIRAEYDRKIAEAAIDDPYSGKRLENFADFEAYSGKLREERLAAEAKKTGKSVAALREEEENRAFISQMRRNAGKPAERMDLAKDAAEFRAIYPDADPVKLEQDQRFRRFAGSRMYREPLAVLYGDYLEVTNGAAKAAQAKAESKAQRSTGSGDGGGEVKLTGAQQAELDAWNKKYPSMKMTAREFAGR